MLLDLNDKPVHLLKSRSCVDLVQEKQLKFKQKWRIFECLKQAHAYRVVLIDQRVLKPLPNFDGKGVVLSFNAPMKRNVRYLIPYLIAELV